MRAPRSVCCRRRESVLLPGSTYEFARICTSDTEHRPDACFIVSVPRAFRPCRKYHWTSTVYIRFRLLCAGQGPPCPTQNHHSTEAGDPSLRSRTRQCSLPLEPPKSTENPPYPSQRLWTILTVRVVGVLTIVGVHVGTRRGRLAAELL